MGKRIEMDLEEKVFLVKEDIKGRIKGREAADLEKTENKIK